MQRYFVPQEYIQNSQIIVTDNDMLHQMVRVLRMQPGNTCIFLDNTCQEYTAKLETITKQLAIFKIEKTTPATTELDISITVYQALPKKMEIFEWVLEKGTELGVIKFVPMVTEFCNRRELLKRDREMRIITESAEQSERGVCPTLGDVISFEKGLDAAGSEALLFHSRDTTETLKDFLGANKSMQKFSLFIGPEGGFSEREVELAKSKKIPVLSLGKSILRTETAAIVAVANIAHFR